MRLNRKLHVNSFQLIFIRFFSTHSFFSLPFRRHFFFSFERILTFVYDFLGRFDKMVHTNEQMLIDFGADVNSIYRLPGNVVQTPLDCALSKGFRSTAKYLQLHGGLPANKLRLSGRKPNALNDQELVTPLTFNGDRRMRTDEMRKGRNVVLYVKRSDSETNDTGLLI